MFFSFTIHGFSFQVCHNPLSHRTGHCCTRVGGRLQQFSSALAGALLCLRAIPSAMPLVLSGLVPCGDVTEMVFLLPAVDDWCTTVSLLSGKISALRATRPSVQSVVICVSL